MPDKYWRPTAGAIPTIETITITGTPVLGDDVSVEINNSTLTVTIGELVTTDDVAEALMRAINAISSTDNIVGTESRNTGGLQIPEFTRISATRVDNTVVLTGVQPGEVWSSTVSKTGTVAIAVVVTQSATGPTFIDNADNYSGGSLPVSGDTVIVDQGTTGLQRGLGYFRTNTVDVAFRVTGDFHGTIGLPRMHQAGFVEPNERFLQVYDAAGARSIDVVPGVGGTFNAGALRFDLQSQTWDEIRVSDGITAVTSPNLIVHGGSVDLLSAESGWITVDPEEAEQAAGMTIDAIVVGKKDSSSSNPRLTVGRLTAWNTGGTPVDVLAGSVDIKCALDQGTPEATLTVHGGVVRSLGDGTMGAVSVRGGEFRWHGVGTNTGTVEVWSGGTLDLSVDGRSKSFGTIDVYGGSTVKQGVHRPTLTLIGCTPDEHTLTS